MSENQNQTEVSQDGCFHFLDYLLLLDRGLATGTAAGAARTATYIALQRSAGVETESVLYNYSCWQWSD